MIHNINHTEGSKKDRVEGMFNTISHRYDFLNHFLSLNVDRLWRRKAIAIIGKYNKPEQILDVATGTADLAIASLKLNPVKVTGIDISENMLAHGRKKVSDRGLSDKIELRRGDSEDIAFPDMTFDVAMAAFGVRNFGDVDKGLKEMFRVLKGEGMIMVLEFSKPAHFPFRQIYNFYFTKILPWFGGRISGDREAYSYLPDSVMSFPENDQFLKMLHNVGFTGVKQKRLSGGIASIYFGFKR